jgi:acylphosphatase
MKEVRLRLHGDVQGVGFRDYVRRLATRHGVKGFVRNLPDGSVEVVAQGEPLRTFLDSVRRGPSYARVASVDEEERDAAENWFEFEIRY